MASTVSLVVVKFCHVKTQGHESWQRICNGHDTFGGQSAQTVKEV